MKRPSAAALVVTLLLVVLLPVLYVLSIGPAHALVESEVLSAEVMQTIYFPVVLGAYYCGLDDYLFRYIDFCAGTNLQEERFGPLF